MGSGFLLQLIVDGSCYDSNKCYHLEFEQDFVY